MRSEIANALTDPELCRYVGALETGRLGRFSQTVINESVLYRERELKNRKHSEFLKHSLECYALVIASLTSSEKTSAKKDAARKTQGGGLLIGYARVSTQDQNLELQTEALHKAGCKKICEDRVSRTRAARPGLTQARESLRASDTLVVWKLDRLG